MAQVIKKKYELVRSTNEPVRSNFEGNIIFDWGNKGSQWSFNPSLSFWRVRLRFLASNVAGNTLQQPLLLNGIAPNMYVCDNLFQSMYMRINGVQVEKMNNYVPQISALKNRMKPQTMIKNKMKSLEFSELTLYERMNRICSDGEAYGNSEDYIYYKRNVIGLTDNAGNALLTTNTFSLAATGILTFAIGTVPNVSQIFLVGDILTITLTVVGPITIKRDFQVSRLIDATTIQLESFTAGMSVSVAGQALAGVAGNIGILLTRKLQKPRANEIEVTYKPKLGFFELNEWLPNGNYSMEFQPFPHEQYMRHIIESVENMTPFTDFSTQTITSRLQYRVEVVDIRFHPFVGMFASPSQNMSLNLAFESISCQSKAINDNSLVGRDYKIHKNAHALSFCFQDPSVYNDTRYSMTKFKIRNDYEQSLNRFYIVRGGQTLPTPQYDLQIQDASGLANGNIEYIAQIYNENITYSNMNSLGGVETLREWLDKGLYLHYDIRDYGMGSDVVQISQQFRDALTTNVINILVFDHRMVGVKLNMSNGIISEVECTE